MKQLLFIAYAAHIKVSPRTHDIKESMLHSNLGHHLPSENASRMLKQIEQPMNQKLPQLGFEQRSSKQPRICMNATAPFPPTPLRLCPQQCLEGGWWGKVEHGSSITLQYKQLKEAERSGTPLKLEVSQGAQSSMIKWGSLGLLMCAHWHWFLRTINPHWSCLPPSLLFALQMLTQQCPRELWAEDSLVERSFQIHSLAKPGSIIPFLSVFSRPGTALVKYLCYP